MRDVLEKYLGRSVMDERPTGKYLGRSVMDERRIEKYL
jgi:hypothetical protein